MNTPTTTITVERVDPLFSPSEQLALAGFLAGYSGLTRDAYALDLRQFVRWCTEHDLVLFGVRRADIECFGRELEAKGKARATVARRLTTIVGFYRYAEEEGLIAVSPGAHVRVPGWTWSPTPWGSTATKSEACSWSPASVTLGTTPSSPCFPSTVCASPKLSEPISRTWASNGATGRCWCGARAARSSASSSRPS